MSGRHAVDFVGVTLGVTDCAAFTMNCGANISFTNITSLLSLIEDI